MAPRLSGQNCKFLKFLLSLYSQKRLGYKENNTKYRSLTWKPRSHVRILIYRTWPITSYVTYVAYIFIWTHSPFHTWPTKSIQHACSARWESWVLYNQVSWAGGASSGWPAVSLCHVTNPLLAGLVKMAGHWSSLFCEFLSVSIGCIFVGFVKILIQYIK